MHGLRLKAAEGLSTFAVLLNSLKSEVIASARKKNGHHEHDASENFYYVLSAIRDGDRNLCCISAQHVLVPLANAVECRTRATEPLHEQARQRAPSVDRSEGLLGSTLHLHQVKYR